MPKLRDGLGEQTESALSHWKGHVLVIASALHQLWSIIKSRMSQTLTPGILGSEVQSLRYCTLFCKLQAPPPVKMFYGILHYKRTHRSLRKKILRGNDVVDWFIYFIQLVLPGLAVPSANLGLAFPFVQNCATQCWGHDWYCFP